MSIFSIKNANFNLISENRKNKEQSAEFTVIKQLKFKSKKGKMKFQHSNILQSLCNKINLQSEDVTVKKKNIFKNKLDGFSKNKHVMQASPQQNKMVQSQRSFMPQEPENSVKLQPINKFMNTQVNLIKSYEEKNLNSKSIFQEKFLKGNIRLLKYFDDINLLCRDQKPVSTKDYERKFTDIFDELEINDNNNLVLDSLKLK